jgi:DNA adenine methylase
MNNWAGIGMISCTKAMLLQIQPIPYQGSKRKIASRIFEFAPENIDTLYEPFAGSAAVTLFAANKRLAKRYVINDSFEPLVTLLKAIIDDPEKCASAYEKMWEAQHDDHEAHYYKIRDEFNKTGDPVKFLFLMAKCVKNAVRFNQKGEFNQSPDKRRTGRSPDSMRKHLICTSLLLKGKVSLENVDYAEVIKNAGPSDLVYMDPPYQGTSTNRDSRYHQGIDLERLIDELDKLNQKDVPFLLSFDGQLGDKQYGYLPEHLNLERIDVHMGRSAQATLNGKDSMSIESLYISPNLVAAKKILNVVA